MSTMETPTPLRDIQIARDRLREALTDVAMPTSKQLEALKDLSDECRARAGASEADALDQLLFGRAIRASPSRRSAKEKGVSLRIALSQASAQDRDSAAAYHESFKCGPRADQ